MAITKYSERVAAEKAALRLQIVDLNESIVAATSRVPAAVINASHQLAVAWRDAAEKAISRPLSVGSKRASAYSLCRLIERKQEILNLLRNPKP